MVSRARCEGAKRGHGFPLIRRQGETPLHLSFQQGAFPFSGRLGTGHLPGDRSADIGILAGFDQFAGEGEGCISKAYALLMNGHPVALSWCSIGAP